MVWVYWLRWCQGKCSNDLKTVFFWNWGMNYLNTYHEMSKRFMIFSFLPFSKWDTCVCKSRLKRNSLSKTVSGSILSREPPSHQVHTWQQIGKAIWVAVYSTCTNTWDGMNSWLAMLLKTSVLHSMATQYISKSVQRAVCRQLNQSLGRTGPRAW